MSDVKISTDDIWFLILKIRFKFLGKIIQKLTKKSKLLFDFIQKYGTI